MKILFYYPGSLRNRRRGTPLRVYAIYESLRKLADVYLVARELPEDARERSMALEPPRKGLDWLLQTRVLRRTVREFQPDLFYGHTHLAILPLLLAAGRHAKTCVDLHGLPHHELGLQGVHKWATAGWHRMLIKRLTGITAVCDPLTRFYRGDAASGFTFHGGVDGQAMEALTPAAIDKSAGSVITYCGNARRYQGVDVLLAALAKIREEPWQLLLVLSSREAEVRRLLENYGLTGRVTIKQDLDQIEVFAHLKAADIAVVPRPDIPITRYALPSKLPEYLASGTAVVATAVGDAHRLLSDRETGWRTARQRGGVGHRAETRAPLGSRARPIRQACPRAHARRVRLGRPHRESVRLPADLINSSERNCAPATGCNTVISADYAADSLVQKRLPRHVGDVWQEKSRALQPVLCQNSALLK